MVSEVAKLFYAQSESQIVVFSIFFFFKYLLFNDSISREACAESERSIELKYNKWKYGGQNSRRRLSPKTAKEKDFGAEEQRRQGGSSFGHGVMKLLTSASANCCCANVRALDRFTLNTLQLRFESVQFKHRPAPRDSIDFETALYSKILNSLEENTTIRTYFREGFVKIFLELEYLLH